MTQILRNNGQVLKSGGGVLQKTLPTLPTLDPVLYLPFNAEDISGTNVEDKSGNNNTVTLINGATWSSDNGGIITVDGVNDSVKIDDSPSVSFSSGVGKSTTDYPFTLMGWFYVFTGEKSNASFILKYGGSPGTQREWYIVCDGSGKVAAGNLNYYPPESNILNALTIDVIPENTWFHLTRTYDASKVIGGMKIYINSVEKATTDTSTRSEDYDGFPDNAQQIDLGANIASNIYSYMRIGEVRMYDQELSQPEIETIYQETSSVY